LSPQSVASTSFKTVKKGYDPAEVRSYLATLSKSIESLQSQATAMEARARAAVARLQEIAAQPTAKPAIEPSIEPTVEPTIESAADAGAASTSVAQSAAVTERSLVAAHVDEAETISRTLLLAQRTADTTVAEAELEAKRITDAATDEGRMLVSGAQDTAGRLVEESKAHARRAGEAQRVEVESEVQSLLARREFLVSDVDHLELHIVTQRDRLRDVASALNDIVNKVPGGLGDIRRPLVSAVADESGRRAESADQVSAPVLEALESSSAVSGLDADTNQVADTEATQGIEMIADADAPDAEDPESEAPDSDTPVSGGLDVAANAAGPDGTPPSGQLNQFLFEDITAEVPTIPTGPSSNATTRPNAGDFTIRGDELR